ncbi:MAG: 1-deoxy-D-xylulose-5-phosphate synthase [Burkholderiales bacterium]|nr:1-deoxy-D-xylulose-5-phosphate synthase [Burkholderiales bacterium]
MKTRIMYIESKENGLIGEARIGRVSFSKTGATIYYRGKAFQSLKGYGYKANYFEVESGEKYWISGPKKNGQDQLYPTNVPVEVDDDVREEYWSKIRGFQARARHK